jgi:hypothetical protein
MFTKMFLFIWVSGGLACPCGGLRRIPPSLWLSTATSSDIFITIFHNPIQLMCHFGKSVNHAHCATQSKCKRGHAHQNMVGPIEISQRPTTIPLLEIDFWISGKVCSYFCPDQAEAYTEAAIKSKANTQIRSWAPPWIAETLSNVRPPYRSGAPSLPPPRSISQNQGKTAFLHWCYPIWRPTLCWRPSRKVSF